MSNETTNTDGIKKVFNAITVDEIKENKFNADMMQAQLRQVVTTVYPAKRVSNSKSGNVFGIEAFGLEDGQSHDATRMHWMDIPKTVKDVTTGADRAITPADVEAMLAKYPSIRIRREIANNVKLVLTEEQTNALTNDAFDYSLEDAEAKHEIIVDGESLNPKQYSQLFLSLEGEEDDDFRVTESVQAVQATIAVDALEA